jgi:hypothetical protein
MSDFPLNESLFSDGFGAETPEAASWRCFFEEKTDLVERVRGLPRLEAERAAYKILLVEWINRQTVGEPAAASNRCAWCGLPEAGPGDLRPYGTDARGVAWLHPERCWKPWTDRRHTDAVEALRKIGITEPPHDAGRTQAGGGW